MAKKHDDDLGQTEVQKTVDAEQEQGYRGAKADPRPNSDYSLESGPDSPSALEQQADELEARAKALRGGTA